MHCVSRVDKRHTLFEPFGSVLQVSVGTMSVQGAQGLTQKHYMDVCGPLLPHALRDIRIMLTPSHSELSVHTVESNHSSAFNRALGQYT